MGLVMQLLAMPDIPHVAIRKVSESTEIPMGPIRRWRHDGFSPDPPSRALNARQESDLAERLPVEYVLTGRYCPPATVNRLALAMRADSLASQSSSPRWTAKRSGLLAQRYGARSPFRGNRASTLWHRNSGFASCSFQLESLDCLSSWIAGSSEA
jgi:hypothetical protein